MSYVAVSSLESNCRALQIYGARLGRKRSPTARRAWLIAESVYAAAPESEFAITQSGCAIRVGRTLGGLIYQIVFGSTWRAVLVLFVLVVSHWCSMSQ